MAARKLKQAVITADQAEWLEEILKEVIHDDVSPVPATLEIAKALKCSRTAAKIVVDRANDVRDAMEATEGLCPNDRSLYEDVVNAYKHLDKRLQGLFKVKGKRYEFYVGS
jgi:hypothetical protein